MDPRKLKASPIKKKQIQMRIHGIDSETQISDQIKSKKETKKNVSSGHKVLLTRNHSLRHKVYKVWRFAETISFFLFKNSEKNRFVLSGW